MFDLYLLSLFNKIKEVIGYKNILSFLKKISFAKMNSFDKYVLKIWLKSNNTLIFGLKLSM